MEDENQSKLQLARGQITAVNQEKHFQLYIFVATACVAHLNSVYFRTKTNPKHGNPRHFNGKFEQNRLTTSHKVKGRWAGKNRGVGHYF